MMKILVKWTFTDDYGRPSGAARFEWFDTMEEANEFIATKRKGNGGYFYLWKEPFEANYDNYLLMREYERKAAELWQEFK